MAVLHGYLPVEQGVACYASLAKHTDRLIAGGDSTTLANGRGVCERGNYVREMPGWQIILVHDGTGRHPHTITVSTPTGHTYRSRAPNP